MKHILFRQREITAVRRRIRLFVISLNLALGLLGTAFGTGLADSGQSPPANTNVNCFVSSQTTNCLQEGSITLQGPTNTPILPSGTMASITVTPMITPGQVVVITCYTNGSVAVQEATPIIAPNPTPLAGAMSTNCPCTSITNSVSPVINSTTWSVSGPGGFSANGNGLTATFTPTNSGSATVSFTSTWQHVCDAGTSMATVNAPVNVANLTLGANKIWWFNGENPGGGYNLTTTATVAGAPNGAVFQWAVTGPANIAGNGASVTVTGTGPSAAANDVSVTVKVNGVALPAAVLTVLAPDHQTHQSDTDNINGNGWQSLITYKIFDQFNNVLPFNVPWNEDIDGNGAASTAAQVTAAAIPDFVGENWQWGAEGSATVNPAGCSDNFSRAGAGLVPPVQNPQTPLGVTKVDHSPQGAWYCGSLTIAKGVKVGNCIWQTYTDHGRHR